MTSQLPPFVSSLDEAFDGIRMFQTAIADPGMVEIASTYRAWYAIKEADGRVLLAPSKFIGYKGFTAQTYLQVNGVANGRQTEGVLGRWFQMPDAASEEFLMQELAKLLGRFGKRPNKLARVSTINGIALMSGEVVQEATEGIGSLEAMMTFYRMLSADEQREFRRRIA